MRLAPQYLRTYFVTAVCAERRRIFQVERAAETFLEVMRTNRRKGRMKIHAFVLMPDHVHFLLTPAHEVPLEKAVQLLKGGFSFQYKGIFEVWDRGYHDQRVVDACSYDAMLRYAEQNPVRAQIVGHPNEYRWSSAKLRDEIDARPTWFGGAPGQG